MILGKDCDVPESKCVDCGRKLNGAMSVDGDHTPSPGDFSICMHCGHFMVFGENLDLRNPTDQEILDIAGDTRVLAIQWARAEVFGPSEDKH